MVRFSRSRTIKLRLALTVRGRALVTRAGRLQLSVTGRYTLRGAPASTRTVHPTLQR